MSKKLIALLMATLMLLSLAAACGNQLADPPKPPATTHDPPAKPADPDADKYGGDLVIANSNISTTIDPHNSQGITGNYAWMVNVYDTILSRDAAGNIFPLICDFTQSEDGKTITLTIREYYYHNGTKIKIEDVLASMERATYFSGSWADTWSKIYATIEGDTLTLQFDELVVDFLPTLGYINPCAFVLPKEICEQHGENIIDDQSVLDGWGSGCYILEAYNPDVAIKMKRNENYVTTINEGAQGGIAAPRKAYMDTITLATNTDNASRTAAMIAGEYHVGGILAEMRPYRFNLCHSPSGLCLMGKFFCNFSEKFALTLPKLPLPIGIEAKGEESRPLGA